MTPVMCFSSGDEAELFLNGKSQGVHRKGKGAHFSQGGVNICKNGHRFVWEDVKYQPGELKVVVRKNGQPWAQASRCTTGKGLAYLPRQIAEKSSATGMIWCLSLWR